MKRPAFQFYPADWRKDAALQSCSIAARGLWHELLCIMHECVPYGHLCINGTPINEQQAARLCGVRLPEYGNLLRELCRAGVPSLTAEGVIFSRRMVKDESIRAVRAEAGKLGGNPLLLNLDLKRGSKIRSKQKPTPSSSSSTSVLKANTARKRAIPLPPEFKVSDRVREWATEKGHTQLGERLEDFVSRVKAKGYVYVDWDEAFMNAIRDDWAKLAGRGKATSAAWWASEADTAAKGKELGLEARPGETLNDFRGRIRAAMERHD